MDGKKSKHLSVYNFWGVAFDKLSDNSEFCVTCPFCNHDDGRTGTGHFFINRETAAFSCKACGKQGSWREFLRLRHRQFHTGSNGEAPRKLTELKGIPISSQNRWEVTAYKNKYLFPVYDIDEEVIDLRWFTLLDGKEKGTESCNTGLLGVKQLNKDKTSPIYICEGFSSCVMLDWMLRKANKPGVVLSTGGANTFKDDWSRFFDGRDTIVCYDHDDAGYGHYDEVTDKAFGSKKVELRLKNYARSIKFITWPEEFKAGYDIRDHVLKYKLKPKNCYNKFTEFITDDHKFTVEPVIDKEVKELANKTSITDILKICSELYELDEDLIIAIKLALATVISVRLPGSDQVWIFLVGPVAGGKTLISGLFQDNRHCMYESTLTRAGLISGFQSANSNNPLMDQSILSKVNNKCLVLKDYTEVLELPDQERGQVESILRGAFDGSVNRQFGNLRRSYKPKFSMFAAVTHKIKAYSTSEAGERFLHFNLNTDEALSDTIAERAIDFQLQGETKSNELKNIIQVYLEKDWDFDNLSLAGRVPRWFKDRVIPLGTLLTRLRTRVNRHAYGQYQGQVIYQPVAEKPNRAVVCLTKAAIAYSLIEEKPEIDKDIYNKVIKRLALNTISGYTTDIVRELVGTEKGLTKGELKNRLRVHRVEAYLEDLEILDIVEKVNTNRYKTKKVINDLWRRARL